MSTSTSGQSWWTMAASALQHITTTTTRSAADASTTALWAAVVPAAVLSCHYLYSNYWYCKPIAGKDAIVVTGTDSGIGKHAALTLAKRGFVVFCGVLDRHHGDELVQLAIDNGIDPSNIKPMLLDVTNAQHIQDAVKHVTAVVGQDHGLYGLFNNAGIGNPVRQGEGRSIEHAPLYQVRKVMDVNFFGTWQVTQAFLPLIRQRQGRIVTNASLAGTMASPFVGPYTASKFAVEAMMDSLRRELLGLGVTVSILEPGFVATPIYTSVVTADQLRSYSGVGVYAQTEVWQTRNMMHLAWTMGVSPKSSTSPAIVHAFQSPTPQLRYKVGGLCTGFSFLARWPAVWTDWFFWITTQIPVPAVSPEQETQLQRKLATDFAL